MQMKYTLDVLAQCLCSTHDSCTYLNNLPAEPGQAQPLRTSGYEGEVEANNSDRVEEGRRVPLNSSRSNRGSDSQSYGENDVG